MQTINAPKMQNKAIKLTTLCLALAGIGFAGNVSAEPGRGFQIGIDGGKAEAEKVCDNVTNCESSDTTVRGNIGYQFNPYVGAEVGYTSFGTLFDSSDNQGHASQEASAITASLVGTVPLGERFGLFARVGAARYDVENSGFVQGVPVASDHNSTRPYYGAGARLNLTDNFALRAEYQIYSDITDVSGGKDDVNAWSGGALFTF